MKKIIFVLLFATNFFGVLSTKTFAQDGYVGEIRIFAGNFAIRDWAICDGSLLPISQNQALFSILGTTYGGNGTTTFALPDLRGRFPMGAGSGSGLPSVNLGEKSGSASVSLNLANLPSHTHTISIPASTEDGNANLPTNAVPANTKLLDKEYTTAASNTAMKSFMSGAAGNSTPVSTLPPYTGVNYIICINGVYPPRN